MTRTPTCSTLSFHSLGKFSKLFFSHFFSSKLVFKSLKENSEIGKEKNNQINPTILHNTKNMSYPVSPPRNFPPPKMSSPPKFILNKTTNNNATNNNAPSNSIPSNNTPNNYNHSFNSQVSNSRSPSKLELKKFEEKKGGVNLSVQQQPKQQYWKNVFYPIIKEPKESELTLEYDEDLVVIKDKFPKSKHHLLVIPRKNLPNFSFLSRKEIPLLQKMIEKGKEKSSSFGECDALVGFHALPSISQIHLHVLSGDLQSDYIKNKKHYNSFATKFFVPAVDFIEKLKEEGKVEFDKNYYEQLLKCDLKCHRCGRPCKNIPTLKEHLSLCKKKDDFIL